MIFSSRAKGFERRAEILNRGIGGIAGVAMLFAPAPTLGIVLAQGQGSIFQFEIEALGVGHLGPVNQGGKQAFHGRFHGCPLISLLPADKGWR